MSEQSPCETHFDVATPDGYCPVCMYNQWQAAEQRAEQAESALRRKTKECELIKQARDRYMPCPDHRDKTTEDDQCQMCRAEQAEHARFVAESNRDYWKERAEQAERSADELGRMFDSGQQVRDELRDQRDTARQESANLREALGKVDTIACEFACCADHEMWRAMKDIHEIVRDAPLHSSDAPASEPEGCDLCGGERYITVDEQAGGRRINCPECETNREPDPADRPQTDTQREALDELKLRADRLAAQSDDPAGEHSIVGDLARTVRQALSQSGQAVPKQILQRVREDADAIGGDHSWRQGVGFALRKVDEHCRSCRAHPADGDSPAVHPKYTRATMEELRQVYSIVMGYIDKLNDPISEAQFNIDAGLMVEELDDALAAAPDPTGDEHG